VQLSHAECCAERRGVREAMSAAGCPAKLLKAQHFESRARCAVSIPRKIYKNQYFSELEYVLR
jgi:hypothetical protein